MFRNLPRCIVLVTLLSSILFRPDVAAAAGNAVYAPPALVSNGGTLTSFSAAINLPLTTDADFGRFVDPQITGTDRTFAIFLLKVMPPGMRGDFVYVNPAGGILSNRLGVASSVRFLPQTRYRQTKSARIPSLTHKQIQSINPNSYPPNAFPGGAGIRYYSVQGINAAEGFASPPCDVSLFGSPGAGDSGNMYFNAYDSNGNDVIDAGLGANITSSSGTTD
jgi:hypothetical protein